jgi:hypothetical protein
MKKKCNGERPCSTCARFQHDCQYQQQKIARRRNVVWSGGDASVGSIAANEATTRATKNSPRENESIDQSILDPEKGRYFDASSAIAFPRLIGIQFGADRAPRLHSFAWNLGIRTEPLPNTLDITGFISLDDVHIYSNDYFMVVHPAFDFLDQQEFIRRASLRWKGNPTEDALNFDAVICGVVALGYFVSRKIDNGIEAAVTSFAKDRLESVALVKPPTADLITAWILRAIYLRATSRPHASWMASNVVMHLIEASGIQRDISSVALIYPSSKGTNIDPAQSLYRRKVFWIGRAINAIFSYEYSRPRIIINKISCARVDTIVNSATRDLLQLADLIPENSQTCDEAVDIARTKSMLESLSAFTTTETPVSLFCADLAFAAYRHLRPMRNFITSITSFADPTISHLLSIGSEALKAIHDQLSKPSPSSPHSTDVSSVTPWWSLISIPFHFILILLSLDTPESLSQVSRALHTLQVVAAVFDTHLTREAVQNATMLIRLAQSRKKRDVKALREALSEISGTHETNLIGLGPSGGDAVVGPERIEIDGLNRSTSVQQQQQRRQQQQQQQQGGKGVAESFNFGTDLSGLCTGNLEGLIIPDSLAMDWDAIFENPDWI